MLYNRLTWRLYAGATVKCNCCGGRFRRFRLYTGDSGHQSLMCPRCGARGRHRVDWLFLTSNTDLLHRPVRVLHVAPESCLEGPLRRIPTVDYLSADYDSALAMEQMDITAIRHEDDSFDGIICNHVLQHVDDDRAAMSELYRVTRNGGWALLQSSVDMSRELTVEDPVTPPLPGDADRYEEVFMRSYGRDYASRLEQAGFEVTVSDFVTKLAESDCRELGLDTAETIFFCRKLRQTD